MTCVKCPHCGANLSVPEEFKNDKQLHCSQCNQNFDNNKEKEKPKKTPQTNLNSQVYKFRWTKRRIEWALCALLSLVSMMIYVYNDDTTPKQIVENSSWDGSVQQVKQYLKSNLKDPDSYQSIKWGNVRQQNDGTYVVWHKFRAKNSFGGYVVYWMSFTLDANGEIIEATTMSSE